MKSVENIVDVINIQARNKVGGGKKYSLSMNGWRY